jgi:hypothetical protein
MKTTILTLMLIGQLLNSNLANGQNFSDKISKPFGLNSKSLMTPIFVDIDNDGDLDVFAVQTGFSAGTIFFQENTGTKTVPSYADVKTNPFGLNSKSLSSPIFVDIDNDGDLDVFAVQTGFSAGTIFFQENTGTKTAPSYTDVKTNPFGLNSKSLSSPIFVDIDNDGDLDVFAVETGMSAGTIYFSKK